MASCPSWLRSLASPHHLASLLLGITICLLTLTAIPPSSAALYLIRTNSITSSHGDAEVSSTVWFGNTGYCTADASTSDIPSSSSSHMRCSGPVFGYDIESILAQDQTKSTPSSTSQESSTISLVLTRGPAVLHPIATGLSLLNMAAHQSILRRPRARAYAAAMGTGLLALLVTCVAFIFEHSLLAYVESVSRLAMAAETDPSTTTTTTTGIGTFSTTDGPLAGITVWTLAIQLAACVVGFYTCIGGKYRCEGGIRLEDSDDAEGRAMVRRHHHHHRSSSVVVNEKCPLDYLGHGLLT